MPENAFAPPSCTFTDRLIDLTKAVLTSIELEDFDGLNAQLAERGVLLAQHLDDLRGPEFGYARAVLEEVQAMDQVATAALNANLDSVRTGLDQLSRWRSALGGYHSGRTNPAPAFLDSTL